MPCLKELLIDGSFVSSLSFMFTTIMLQKCNINIHYFINLHTLNARVLNVFKQYSQPDILKENNAWKCDFLLFKPHTDWTRLVLGKKSNH